MAKRRQAALIIVAVAPIAAFLGLRCLISLARPAHQLGVTEGRLDSCPDRPNCVSTQAAAEQHLIDPLPLEGSAEEAMQRLQSVVSAMPRSRIVVAEDDYLHVEFRSRWLGFADDVEFLVDQAEQAIHFRSASRLGHSDLGVNRKRMEDIRRRFQQASTTNRRS